MTTTPKLLSAEEIAEIKARAEKAPPGPLRYRREKWPSSPNFAIECELPCINGLSAWFSIAHIFIPDKTERGYTDGVLNTETAEVYAQLFATARTDIPAMAAHIAAQDETIERLRRVMATAGKLSAKMVDSEDHRGIDPDLINKEWIELTAALAALKSGDL